MDKQPVSMALPLQLPSVFWGDQGTISQRKNEANTKDSRDERCQNSMASLILKALNF